MARIRDFHSRYRSSILLPSIRIFVRIFSSAKRWNSRSAGGRPWCRYYPAQARLRKLAKRTHSKWVVYKFDSCIWYLHCHGWFVATTVCVKSKVRLPRVEGRHCGGRGAQWSPTLIMVPDSSVGGSIWLLIRGSWVRVPLWQPSSWFTSANVNLSWWNTAASTIGGVKQ